MTLFLLDTNMVSYIVRHRSAAARARLLGLKHGDTGCISAITEAEIRYGLALRPQATALKAMMEGFLASIPILPWASNEAKVYGEVRAQLQRTGKMLGSQDLQIAAHAVALDAILVTHDAAFRQVSDLHAIEDWATDL